MQTQPFSVQGMKVGSASFNHSQSHQPGPSTVDHISHPNSDNITDTSNSTTPLFRPRVASSPSARRHPSHSAVSTPSSSRSARLSARHSPRHRTLQLNTDDSEHDHDHGHSIPRLTETPLSPSISSAYAYARAAAMLERGEDSDSDVRGMHERSHGQWHDANRDDDHTEMNVVDGDVEEAEVDAAEEYGNDFDGPSHATDDDRSESEQSDDQSRSRQSNSPKTSHGRPRATPPRTHAPTSTSSPAGAPFAGRMSFRQWFQSLRQMGSRASLMERDHLSWLAPKKTLFPPNSDELKLIDEVERMYHAATQRIHKERSSIHAQIRNIKQQVESFKTLISTQHEDDASYLDALRSRMNQIESALRTLKATQKERYVAMALEEKDLNSELEAMDRAHQRWMDEKEMEAGATTGSSAAAASASVHTAAASSSEAKSVQVDLGSLLAIAESITSESDSDRDRDRHHSHSYPPLDEFRRAIASLDSIDASEGGSSGGWDPRDHDYFLKLYTQLHHQTPQLLARMVTEILGQNMSTAMAHLEWYERSRQRVEQKKLLLKAWKVLKQRESKSEEERQRELEEQIQEEAAIKRLQLQQTAKEREEKAQAVAEWKRKKAEREAARKAKLRAEEEERKRIQREKQEEERRRLRLAVAAYHEEKAAEEMVEQIHSQPTQREVAEMPRAEREANRRLLARQEATLAAIAAKRVAKEEQKAKEQARQQAITQASKPDINTHRDPSRLTQATAALRARAKQREEEEQAIAEYQRAHGGKTPTTLLSRPVLGARAQVGWRKGL